MGLTGFQRQRRILQGMKPEDGTKPGQITATDFTAGAPDEIQREKGDRVEGVEIPGNQFVDGGKSIAPQSEGVEIPEGQSADPREPIPADEATPMKTAENLTDVGGEPEGPDAEAPSSSGPEVIRAHREAGEAAGDSAAPKKRAGRKTARRKAAE